MTIAEARRRLGVTTNYQLAKRMGWLQSNLTRWKQKNGRIPDKWAVDILALERK